MAWGLVVGIGAMALATIAAGFASSNNSAHEGDQTTDTTEPVEPAAQLTVPPAGEAIAGETPCPATDGSSARVTSFENPPPTCIDPDTRYQAVVRTSMGDVEILLDQSRAPDAVNNFVVLSRYHFYDGVPFFALAPDVLAATGDATGEPTIGLGGPGYTFPSEVPAEGVIYPIGTVAMWMDVPDENGSRFWIAAGEGASALPPDFTAFGIVTTGIETVRAMSDLGNIQGEPTVEVLVESIQINELPADAGAEPTAEQPEESDGTDPTEGTAGGE